MSQKKKTIKIRKLRALADKQNSHCYWCQKPTPRDQQSLDHIVPKSWGIGGGNHIGNLVMACRDCNSQRGNMAAAEYAQKMGVQAPRTAVCGLIEEGLIKKSSSEGAD